MNAPQISVLCSKASLGNYSLSPFSCFHSDVVVGSLTKMYMKLCAFIHALHHCECRGWKSNTSECNLLTVFLRLEKTPKMIRSSCSLSTTKAVVQSRSPSATFTYFLNVSRRHVSTTSLVKKQSSVRGHFCVGCGSPGTNCLHTLGAETQRELCVPRQGRCGTGDRVALRCCGHALLKTMQQMGAKAQEWSQQ